MKLTTYILLNVLATAFEPGDLVNERNVKCMAENIWFEGRGEDFVGQIKIGQTVMNRRNEDGFPNTICGVIWKPDAFTWTTDQLSNSIYLETLEQADRYKEIVRLSVRILSNDYRGIINGSTHYWNKKKVASPCWKDAFDDFLTHGNHTWAYNDNGKTPCWDAKRIAMNKIE